MIVYPAAISLVVPEDERVGHWRMCLRSGFKGLA